MLRAATSINIKSTHITNRQAVLISPIINLDGIVLRCDRPVPIPIKEFLQSCGAVVNRIRYKQEIFIRLTGNFTIPLELIQKFKEENSDLVNAQLEGLNEIPCSTVLRDEVQARQASGSNRNLFFSIQARPELEPISLPAAPCMMVGLDIMTKTNSFTTNSRMFAGRNLSLISNVESLDAEQKFLACVKYEDAPIGVMSESLGMQSVKLMTRTLNVENAIVESGATMDLAALNINLCLERDIDWINNPHPETSSVRLTKNFRME